MKFESVVEANVGVAVVFMAWGVERVMEPLPFVIIISLLVPVMVALVRVLPEEFPIKSWPSV